MGACDNRRQRGHFPRSPLRQAACFGPSWFEFFGTARNLSAPAQNRKGGMILQHGSIPYLRCCQTREMHQDDISEHPSGESMLKGKHGCWRRSGER